MRLNIMTATSPGINNTPDNFRQKMEGSITSMRPESWLMLAMAVLIALAHTAYAGPASPYPFQAKQPDGQMITLKVEGDEFYHRVITPDGYPVMQNQNQYWVYAQLQSDGDLKATDIRMGSSGEKSFKAANTPAISPLNGGSRAREIADMRKQFNIQLERINKQWLATTKPGVKATRKVCVLLVNFSDVTNTYSRALMDSVFNCSGWDHGGIGGPGSLKDYMLEVSDSQLNPTFYVYGWFQDPNPASYYAWNGADPWGRSAEMFARLLTTADPTVDFSQFDNDGDGTCEGIIMVHAGRGASEDGDLNYIWNHMSWLDPAVVKDGKSIANFSNDEEIEYGLQAGPGMYAHEYGHCGFGFPDVYIGPSLGLWCCMAAGSWGNSGHTPTHYSAFIKKKSPWSTVSTVTTNGTYSFNQAAGAGPTIRRCNTFNSLDYFLIENRELAGFDRYLPGPGLMIYHVDSLTEQSWLGDQPVHTEPADNTTGSWGGEAGDPYPGTTGKRAFDQFTVPSSNTLVGLRSFVSVSQISNAGAVMTAYIGVPGGAALQAYALPDTVRPYHQGIDTIVQDFGSSVPDWYATFYRLGQRMTPKGAGTGKVIAVMAYTPAGSNVYRLGIAKWTGTAPGTMVYETGAISTGLEGWRTTYLDPASNVNVSGDFVVTITDGGGGFSVGADAGSNGRTYWQAQGSSGWTAWTYSFYIRVLVDYNGYIDTVQTMTVGNMGHSTTLNVSSITKNQSWIKSISPNSFTVAPGATRAVAVTVSRSGLADGVYFDSLTINSNDAAYNNPIRFKVRTAALTVTKIGVNPDTLRPYYHGTDTLGHYIADTTAAQRWESGDSWDGHLGQKMTAFGPATVKAIMVYNTAKTNNYRLGVCKFTAGVPDTIQAYESGYINSTTAGWKTYDVSAANITVNGDFMVTWWGNLTDGTTLLASSASNGRSYWRAWENGWSGWTYGFYIKAIVQYPSYVDTIKTLAVSNDGYNSSITVSNITAGQSWITGISPTSFTLAPGATQNVSVKVTRNVGNGKYSGALTIASNDSVTPSFNEPVKYTKDDNFPMAVEANGPYAGRCTTQISVSSAGTDYPAGSISTYAWTFGDGGSSSLANPSHAYAATGTYKAKLTATNSIGQVLSDSGWVTVDLPQPWLHQDIGAPTPGWADWVRDTFTVKGGGWIYYDDQSHFVYRPMTGNGAIYSKIISVASPQYWQRVGMMMREDVGNDGAKQVTAFVASTYSGMSYRDTAGVTNKEQVNSGDGGAPKWLKVQRLGDVFSCYKSADGVTWTQVGASRTIVMNPTLYAGMAAAGYNDGLDTVKYCNVMLQPLGVSFAQMTAEATNDGVVIMWRTETEQECYRWEIERSPAGLQDFQTVGSLPGNGTTNCPSEYRFVDDPRLEQGDYCYRLVQIDTDGEKTRYGAAIIHYRGLVPQSYSLEPAVPNPVGQGKATIRYALNQRGRATLAVFNLLGEKVATLVDAVQEPGRYAVAWDGKDRAGHPVANGVYLYRLSSGGFSAVKKMMVLK
jgi:M6 family metalloprotease-like protein